MAAGTKNEQNMDYIGVVQITLFDLKVQGVTNQLFHNVI